MGRIKIEDLPRELKISKKEMRAITGAGVDPDPFRGLIGPNYRLCVPPDPIRSMNPALGRIKFRFSMPPDPV